MAHGHKSYDRPSPEGMTFVRGVAAVDKIPEDVCPACKARVHLDSDGRGHLREWDWIGGVNPGYRLHRCGR